MTLAELMKGSEEIIQRVDQQQHHERVRGSQWRRWQRGMRIHRNVTRGSVEWSSKLRLSGLIKVWSMLGSITKCQV